MSENDKEFITRRSVAGYVGHPTPKPEGVLPTLPFDNTTRLNMNTTKEETQPGRSVAGSEPKPEGVLPSTMPSVPLSFEEHLFYKMESEDEDVLLGLCVAGKSTEVEPKPEGVLPFMSELERMFISGGKKKKRAARAKQAKNKSLKEFCYTNAAQAHEQKQIAKCSIVSAWKKEEVPLEKVSFDPYYASLIYLHFLPNDHFGLMDPDCLCKRQGIVYADTAIHSVRCGFTNYCKGKEESKDGFLWFYKDWRPLFKHTKFCTCHDDFVIFENLGVLRWERVRYLARDVVAVCVLKEPRVWLSMKCRMLKNLQEFVVAPGVDAAKKVADLKARYRSKVGDTNLDAGLSEARNWGYKGSGPIKKGLTLRQRRIQHKADCIVSKQYRKNVNLLGGINPLEEEVAVISAEEVVDSSSYINADATPHYIDAQGHKRIGSHSIGGEGFTILTYNGERSVNPSTVWRWLWDSVQCKTEAWKYNGMAIEVHGYATMNAFNRETVRCEDVISQPLWTSLPLRRFVVRTNSIIKLEELDLSALEAFEVGGHVDYVKLARTAPTECPLSRDMLAHLAPAVSLSLAKVDNSMLYAKGFLLALQLAECERSALPPLPWNVAAGTFEYRDVYIDGPPARILAELVKRDLELGAFVFDSDGATDEDVLCMMLLAQRLPVVGHAEMSIISSCVVMDSWPIRLYGRGARALPAAVWPRAYKMYSFMLQTARQRDELTDAIAGATRAATLYNLQLGLTPVDLEAGPNNQPRTYAYYYNFGVAGCAGMQPRDWNWLWRTLRLGKYPLEGMADIADFEALESMEVANYSVAGTLLNAGLLLSTSTLLEKIQVDGFDLSHLWMNIGHGDIGHTFLDTLMWAKHIGRASPIGPEITYTFGVIFSNHISPRLWWGDEWCGGRINVNPVVAERLWQQTWDWRIPYRFTPLSMSLFLLHWIDVWGIIGHNVNIDISREVMLGTSPNWTGWDPADGEKVYYDTFNSETPFNYVSYTATVINALLQDRRRTRVWHVDWQLWRRTTARGTHITERRLDWQPEKYDTFSMLKPGTVRSWLRRRNSGLSPVITANSWGLNEWGWIQALKKVDLMNAGMLLPGAIVDAPRHEAMTSALALLGIHDTTEAFESRYRKDKLRSAQPILTNNDLAVENKENKTHESPPEN